MWECLALHSSDSGDLWLLARTSHCAAGQGSHDKRSDREIKHTQTCPPSVLRSPPPVEYSTTPLGWCVYASVLAFCVCLCLDLFVICEDVFIFYSNLFLNLINVFIFVEGVADCITATSPGKTKKPIQCSSLSISLSLPHTPLSLWASSHNCLPNHKSALLAVVLYWASTFKSRYTPTHTHAHSHTQAHFHIHT